MTIPTITFSLSASIGKSAKILLTAIIAEFCIEPRSTIPMHYYLWFYLFLIVL